MDVSVLRWKCVNDFNWLFLVNPVQQVTFIPDDGNIHCIETLSFVQNTKMMDRVQKHITVKPWFCDAAFCIFHNFVFLVKCHIRTKVPRSYTVVCGPHRSVKLEFYYNINCVSLIISATSSATLYYQLYSSPACGLFSPWTHQLQWSVLVCVWTKFT